MRYPFNRLIKIYCMQTTFSQIPTAAIDCNQPFRQTKWTCLNKPSVEISRLDWLKNANVALKQKYIILFRAGNAAEANYKIINNN